MPDRVNEPSPLPKIQEITLPKEFQDFLDSIPEEGFPHANAREWTPQEDAFLLEARRRRAPWPHLCKVLKVSHTTALKRFRELTET